MDLKKVVSQFIERIWNDRTLTEINQFLHDDCNFYFNHQTISGIATISQFIAERQNASNKLTMSIKHLLSDENTVTAHWQATYYESHLKFIYQGLSLFEFANGKISMAYSYSEQPKRIIDNYDPSLFQGQFSANLTGSAEKIYALRLCSRNEVSYKKILTHALRNMSIYKNPNAPQLLYPSEIMTEVICREKVIHYHGKNIRCLIYQPKPDNANELPIIIYAHGGGFCFSKPEDCDLLVRNLVYLAKVSVVSVDHKLAPEYPFPHGLADMQAVYEWVQNTVSQKRIPVGLAGDSSGATFALVTSLIAKNERPASLILLAPATDFEFEKHESYRRLAPDGLVYDASFAGFIRSNYAPRGEWHNPDISPIYGDLSQLPPTLLICGDEDPIIDDNKFFFEQAKRAGADIEGYFPSGMPHAFYYALGLADAVEIAHQKMAAFIKRTLQK